MLSKLTDTLSKVSGIVRHGFTVVGGALIGFGLATQVDVTNASGAVDAVLNGITTIATTANGVIGAVLTLVGFVASIKGKVVK